MEKNYKLIYNSDNKLIGEIMEDIKLKNIDIDEFKKEVYSYYLDIFPEEERKPLELIQSSYEKQYKY